jgi:nitrite reductase/ring-hydroxylating ferredoxin subunit
VDPALQIATVMRSAAPRDQIVDAGSAGELRVGELKRVKAPDRPLVVTRAEHGYAAFDERCPRDGASLAEGSVAGDTVRCACGAAFNVMTGRVEAGGTESIVTYAVEERDGRVRVSLDDRLKGGY